MFAMLTLIVCLAGQPDRCEMVYPPAINDMTGQEMTFGECLGLGGQGAALQWLKEHPGYVVKKVRCTPGKPADAGEDI